MPVDYEESLEPSIGSHQSERLESANPHLLAQDFWRAFPHSSDWPETPTLVSNSSNQSTAHQPSDTARLSLCVGPSSTCAADRLARCASTEPVAEAPARGSRQSHGSLSFPQTAYVRSTFHKARPPGSKCRYLLLPQSRELVPATCK